MSKKRILLSLIAAISGCVAAEGQPTTQSGDSQKDASSKSGPSESTTKASHPKGTKKAVVAPLTLDLKTGKICGAKIGMDEATVRKALAEHHVIRIEKVEYPEYFLLQSDDCPAILFRFRGKLELNEIYTNSPEVRLSNGLKLGQPIKKFTARLGQPSPPHQLPSGVDEELTYRVGRFDLVIIRPNDNPKIAVALSLEKHEEP